MDQDYLSKCEDIYDDLDDLFSGTCTTSNLNDDLNYDNMSVYSDKTEMPSDSWMDDEDLLTLPILDGNEVKADSRHGIFQIDQCANSCLDSKLKKTEMDLYDELIIAESAEKEAKLQHDAEFEKLASENVVLTNLLSEKDAKISKLTQENTNLWVNACSLYITAKEQDKRKDLLLSEAYRKIDNILFRRQTSSELKSSRYEEPFAGDPYNSSESNILKNRGLDTGQKSEDHKQKWQEKTLNLMPKNSALEYRKVSQSTENISRAKSSERENFSSSHRKHKNGLSTYSPYSRHRDSNYNFKDRIYSDSDPYYKIKHNSVEADRNLRTTPSGYHRSSSSVHETHLKRMRSDMDSSKRKSTHTLNSHKHTKDISDNESNTHSSREKRKRFSSPDSRHHQKSSGHYATYEKKAIEQKRDPNSEDIEFHQLENNLNSPKDKLDNHRKKSAEGNSVNRVNSKYSQNENTTEVPERRKTKTGHQQYSSSDYVSSHGKNYEFKQRKREKLPKTDFIDRLALYSSDDLEELGNDVPLENSVSSNENARGGCNESLHSSENEQLVQNTIKNFLQNCRNNNYKIAAESVENDVIKLYKFRNAKIPFLVKRKFGI